MDKLKGLHIIGAIISGIVASICCIGPVVLSILSIGGAGLFSKFESFRPYFIIITIILLGYAFYLTYRKRKIVCEDGTCKIEGAGKWNKIALWVATVVVFLSLLFPYLISSSNQNPISNQIKGEIVEATIPVEGMTCSGCEFNVENGIKKLDGIIKVKANHQKGEAYVKFEKGKVTVDDIVKAINKTGYKAGKPE